MILDNLTVVKQAIEHNQNHLQHGCNDIVRNEWQQVIGALVD